MPAPMPQSIVGSNPSGFTFEDVPLHTNTKASKRNSMSNSPKTRIEHSSAYMKQEDGQVLVSNEEPRMNPVNENDLYQINGVT